MNSGRFLLLPVLAMSSFAWAATDSVFKAPQESYEYAATMKEAAKKFKGTPGVYLQIGDSITHANQNTQYARGGQGLNEEEKAFLKWSHAGERNDSDGWYLAAEDVDGGRRSYTATGGLRADGSLAGGFNGLPSLADLLKKYNPQFCLYMLGTNDLRSPTPVDQYIASVEKAMDLILANGTVPILSTLPPFKGRAPHVETYNKALRELAAKKKLPLLDLHAEMKARGGDEIETLYLSDGVHLTHSVSTGPANDENLKKCGYLLRCYLAVHKGMEVKAKVVDAK